MADKVVKRSNPLVPLTEAEIRATAFPAEGRAVLRDPACRGLVLRSSAPTARYPKGNRTWSLELRVRGRRRRFTVGRYPETGLAEARKLAGKLRAEILEGSDPIEEARSARRERRLKLAGAADAASLRTLLDSFERLSARARGLKAWRRKREVIEYNFGPTLDKQPDALTRADFRAVLDAAVSRGSPMSGKEAAKVLRRVLNWAVERELIAKNPAAGLNLDELTRPDRMRQRVLSDDEIRRVWLAADRAGVFGDLARLYLLTGLRREELAALRWTDLEHDIILLGDTKSGTPHRLPLSGAALEIIRRQPRRSEEVFRGRAGGRIARMGASWSAERLALHAASQTTGWTWHDLRRTCRTLLARIGVDDIVAELIINHVTPGRLRRNYNLHRYENEMREALERLAAFIARIVAGEASVTEPRPAGWTAPERTRA